MKTAKEYAAELTVEWSGDGKWLVGTHDAVEALIQQVIDDAQQALQPVADTRRVSTNLGVLTLSVESMESLDEEIDRLYEMRDRIHEVLDDT